MDRSSALTAAVVCLYRDQGGSESLVHELSRQVSLVIVIDDSGRENLDANGSHPPGASDGGIVRVCHLSNRGLGSSLNEGVRLARQSGAEYIATFDQDTRVDGSVVTQMVSRLMALRAQDIDAGVGGPGLVGGRELSVDHDWTGGRCSLHHIQSGMVFHAEVFDAVGPFREDFHIDGLEQDFLLRLHASGRHTVVFDGLRVEHEIGTPIHRRVLGRMISVTGHPPDRYYYIWRNHLTWILAGWRDEPAFARDGLAWLARWTLLSIILGPSRVAVGTSSVRGFADFIRRKYGPR